MVKEQQPLTPLYKAFNNDKYVRRGFLQRIAEEFRVSLVISYISPLGLPIDQWDPLLFNEPLSKLERKVQSILLILHSYGGDPDIAEKLVEILRENCRRFYVAIPERAKSAATIISLGSDRIYMLESSELGPIDPQIRIKTPSGEVWRPAHSVLDSVKLLTNWLSSNQLNPTIAAMLLQSIDLTTLDWASKTIKHAEELAKKLLTKYMLKNLPQQQRRQKADDIARYLSDANRHLSHGRPIRWKEAKELGLKVSLLKKRDIKAELLWNYFTHVVASMRKEGKAKLLESSVETCMTL
ncbi:SDH family Clp fold serine proteinase [Desulfurobacterium crinifex]